jgi:hypothetical protein
LEDRLVPSFFPPTTNGIHIFEDQLPGGLSNTLAQFLATHTDGTQKILLSETNQLQALNPNYTVLHYQLGTGNSTYAYIINNQWANDYGTVNQHEDWFAHQTYAGEPQSASDLASGRVGNSTGWYQADIANPAWQQYTINQVLQNIAATGGNGWFADSFTFGIGGAGYDGTIPTRYQGTNAATPSAWPAGVDWTTQLGNWAQAIENGFSQYNAANGTNYKFIPNLDARVTSWEPNWYDSANGVPFIDGGFLEGFGEWTDTYDWTLSMNRGLNLSDNGKIVIMQPYPSAAPGTAAGDQQVDFFVGTYLLLKGDQTYLNVLYGGGAQYFPQYQINLGAPTSPLPSDVSAYLWNGVYRRDFQNGFVLVNPGSTTYTLDLGGTYRQAHSAGGGTLTADLLDGNGNYAGGTLTYQNASSVTLTGGSAAIFLSSPETLTWNGTASTDWNTPANWTDPNGGHAVPGAADTAVIVAGSRNPVVNASTTVGNLTVTGGTLQLNAGLTVTGNVSYTGGAIAGTGVNLILAGSSAQTIQDTTGILIPNLVVNNAAGVTVTADSHLVVAGLTVSTGTLTLNSTATDTGNFAQSGGSILYNAGGLMLILQGDINRSGGSFSTASGVVGTVVLSGQPSRSITDTSGTAWPDVKIINDNISGILISAGTHLAVTDLTLAAVSTLILQGTATLSVTGTFTDKGTLHLTQPTSGAGATVPLTVGTLTLAGTAVLDLTVASPANGNTYRFVQYGSLSDSGATYIVRGNGPFNTTVVKTSPYIAVVLGSLAPDTFTWTGTVSGDWATAGNWTDAIGLHAVPTAVDTAVIHGAPFDPVLSAATTVGNLWIPAGYLFLNANLTVLGTFTQPAGFLAFGSNADQLQIAGNVNRTGGLFLGTAGIVVLDGGSQQSVTDTSGHPFGWNLIVSSGTTVTVQPNSVLRTGNDFTDSGTVNLSMASGSGITPTPLVIGHNLIEGAGAVFNLTLGNTNAGLVYVFLTFGVLEIPGATFNTNAGTIHHYANTVLVAT